MEIIAVLFIVLFAVIFLKIIAALLHVSIFMLTLPFKILAGVLSVIVVGVILIPLGLIAGIAGLILAPLALLLPLLPLLLIGGGIWFLLKNR